MKFSTDTGKYGKWFYKYYKVRFIIFNVKACNDCIILYDLSMLLTYFLTCYRNNTIEVLGIEEQNLMISQKIWGCSP